jgi:hypothetical protein
MTMPWGRGWRRHLAAADIQRIRDAVRDLVETERSDVWLAELPDEALIRLAAPLEMLTFQYHLDPPCDRHLVRAARVACEAMSQHLDACPADLAAALRHVGSALGAEEPASAGPRAVGPARRGRA